MKIGIAITVVLLGMLAACAKQENPQNEQLYHLVADRPVICRRGPDCSKKWARAIAWVEDHMLLYAGNRKIEYPIHKLTTSVIKADMDGTSIQISKIPLEDGTYRMEFTTDCDSNDECYRGKGRPLKMSFVSSMIGLPAGVTQTSPVSYRVDSEVLQQPNYR